MGCEQNSKENKFNQNLATEVGADDYGMKKYTMAFLKRGPNRDLTEEEANNLQRQHLDNIHKMAEDGTLLLAGPFLDDGDVRGIYIFNIESVEEAQKIADSWPDSIDDQEAKVDWGWKAKFNLEKLTSDMFKNLSN